ncbi:MAG: sensor histidine kinase [Caldilineaceae bacterium]|nr:sensor histidine kinase [Caldilineaceae bacterium]
MSDITPSLNTWSGPRGLARACLPVLLLIGLELLGLIAAANQMELAISRFSAGVSLLLVISGLMMPVLRPGSDTRLAAILALLLAGLLVVPFDIGSVSLESDGPLLFNLPIHALLRYFNATLAIPVGLHLASRFPPRSPRSAAQSPSDRQLLLIYLLTTALTIGMLLPAQGWLRPALGIPTIGWMLFLLILAHLQLIRVSRDDNPAWLRSASQARLLLLGFLLAEAPLLLRLLLFGLGWPDTIPYDVALLFQAAVPLTVAYAIQRHDLFEIDAAVRRALAYTGVSAVLLGIYFGFTDFLSRILAQLLPQFQTAAILFTLVMAALAFRPLYQLLVGFVDRLFYPERLRFAQVMADVRNRLQQVLPRRQIFSLLVDDLPVALDSVWANLVLVPAQDVPGHTESQPAWNGRLEVGDRVLGRYWLGPRRSGLPFDASEQAQLQSVVSQAALALAYAQTLEELNNLNLNLEEQVAAQTARVLDQQRALAVAEERQRLARDLHDSVTQTLFSISLGSRALGKLALRDPGATSRGLAEQESAAQQALAEMRTLLAQLRSPLVAEGGLPSALAAHCASLAPAGLAVRVEVEDGADVPPQMAEELLYIAKEALHNVVKYAAVSQATCRLIREADGLLLEVTDRGRGFIPGLENGAAGHGLGMHSMRERAQKIGGLFSVVSAPGQGTTVRVRVEDDRVKG